MSDKLEAGICHSGRMIQIVENRVHFYPKEKDSKAISFRLVHDAFLFHRDTTYHADAGEIVVQAPQSHNAWGLYLMVETWLSNTHHPDGLQVADRIIVKEKSW